MSEYRQHGSKRRYPGKGEPTKGQKKQVSMCKPDDDRPGIDPSYEDFEAYDQKFSGRYPKR